MYVKHPKCGDKSQCFEIVIKNCTFGQNRKSRSMVQYSLPDYYKKMSKKCNSPGIFPFSTVFKRIFFEDLQKKNRKM